MAYIVGLSGTKYRFHFRYVTLLKQKLYVVKYGIEHNGKNYLMGYKTLGGNTNPVHTFTHVL